MNKILSQYFPIAILLIVLNTSPFKAQVIDPDVAGVSAARMNINNISTVIYSNGIADHEMNGNSSFIYPKGKNKTAIFMSGFLWGAIVNGQVRTGGSAYRSGLLPGRILEDGTRQDLSDPANRIYRVRRDFATSDLTNEISDEKKSFAEIFNRYQKDWNEWPAVYGAPYEDLDGNGKYDPVIDIPGVRGADQTVWFVANDLDSAQCDYLFGSPSVGVEAQYTIWAYDSAEPLGNTIFKKLKLINKSGDRLEDMYFGLWADPDLGDAGDDLVGCDTTAQVVYVYNSKSTDNTYTPLNPPSVGFALLRGPLVDGNPGDSGFFENKKIFGKKNLGMTAFSYIIKSFEPSYQNYELGALKIYGMLRGLDYFGNLYEVPQSLGGGYTKFPLSGDPAANTGYTAFTPGVSPYFLPGDKRMMLCTGPFNLAQGDTQEVIMAQVAAGAEESVNYLNAVTLMKGFAQGVRSIFNAGYKPIVNLSRVRVNFAQSDRAVILKWSSAPAEREFIENGNFVYGFEGYNIYQIPNPESPKSGYRLIKTFDRVDNIDNIKELVPDPLSNTLVLKLVQPGSDSGLQRFIRIDRDYLKDAPLNNGSDYYFGVSHYSYAGENFFPKFYESPVTIIRATPAAPPPGERFGAAYGDSIAADHVSGSSLAKISAFIVDPGSLTGDNYNVYFHEENGRITFDLERSSDGVFVVYGEKNLNSGFDYLVTDGFILRVQNDSAETLTASDRYTFTTPAPVLSREAEKEDIRKINVFPNPFYAYNSNAVMPNERYITFSHLTKGTVVNVFNLAGQLVKKLVNESDSQFLRWNLLNDSDFMIPSGIYIAYVQVPVSGEVKILKFAIIQGEYISR